jgi:hypothetical protein
MPLLIEMTLGFERLALGSLLGQSMLLVNDNFSNPSKSSGDQSRLTHHVIDLRKGG